MQYPREGRRRCRELGSASFVTGGDPARRGYHIARAGANPDRSYVAVSDLPESELADFVGLFRAAVAAEREENRPK